MPSSHLILCRPLLLLPSILPSIRVFSNESALHIKWPKYWSLSFNISPSNEYPGLISFRMDWLDLLREGRDLGVAFQAPPGSQASSRREAKDSALLSSRDAGLLEPPERPLFDPMDYSPPGSSVHWILQARIQEWVATQTRRGLTLLSQLCRDPAVGVRNGEEA